MFEEAPNEALSARTPIHSQAHLYQVLPQRRTFLCKSLTYAR